MAINKNQATKLEALRVAMKSNYKEGLGGASSDWEKIGMKISSSTNANAYGWMGKFPQLQKWVGKRSIKNIKEHGFVVPNEKFESTLGVARTDIEDDNLGQYGVLARAMGEEVLRFREANMFGALAKGHQTLIYDGQNFFDNDHPVYPNTDGSGSATSAINLFGSGSNPAWYLLDASRTIKPVVLQERTQPEFETITDTQQDHVFTNDEFLYGIRYRCAFTYGFWQLVCKSTETLNEAGFNKVFTAMRRFTADGGQPLGIKPTLLVVPPALESTAEKLIKAQFLDGGQSNTLYNKVEILVSPYL